MIYNVPERQMALLPVKGLTGTPAMNKFAKLHTKVSE